VVAVDANGVEQVLVAVRDNHQRLQRHRVDARGVRRLRLVVASTNGASEARVFEVRVEG
jgi:hypothetical protein